METADLPDRPLTPEENEGNKLLKGAFVGEIDMGSGRRVLNADELYELKDARPRFEKELRLPLDSRGGTSRVYMFSVDGMLRGTFVKGALFAGECMLIQANSFENAHKIAKDGLRSTIEALQHELEQRPVVELPEPGSIMEAGLATDAAGKHGRIQPGDNVQLRTDPKLKAMLAHILGGKPWKW